MLQFILGRASSGKTEKILELIGEDIKKQDAKAVLLVPEQFSFEAEKMLLERFLEAGAAKVSVLNFTRLFDEVGRQSGLIAGKRMSESDAVILMGKALLKEKDALKCFNKFAQNESFADVCVSTVAELKAAAVSSKQLYKAAKQVSGRLKTKLEDLALIMDSYNMQVSGKFIDPRNLLDHLYDMLIATKYFKGKNVYIDGFKGFTGQQFKILQLILEQADKVFVSLCCDDIKEPDQTFDTVVKTRKKLESYAAKNIAEPIVLKESYYNCDELKALEKMFFCAGECFEGQANNVTLCTAQTPEDEADYAMHTIRKMVSEKAMRYKDFAIIVRDTAKYERFILKAAQKYAVACYVDTTVSAADLPLFVFALSALSATLNFTTDNILKYLKTGMSALDDEQVSRLENYAYIWDIKGKDWANEWTMNPDGMQMSDPKHLEKSEKELQELNALRQKVIEPIINLRNCVKGQNTIDIATALWELLTACDVTKTLEHLAQQFEKEGKFKEADLTRRSFDVFCEVLDHTVDCLDEVCDKKEFITAFLLATKSANMGSVPQTLDQVLFGSADRIRTHRPKVVIALGLNSGEWPMSMPSGNLLSAKDRRLLIENGIAVADIDKEFAADENFLCYSSLCAPSDYLYAVCHASFGKDATPCSYAFSAIRDTLPNCKEDVWPKKQVDLEDIKSEKMAFSVLADNIHTDSLLKEALLKRFEQSDEWAGKVQALKRANQPVDMKLKKETVKKIIPQRISMSPSATETFSRCRFSYFCQYLLKAKIIEKANLNVLQRGTMVHYVLENLVDAHKKDLALLNDDQIKMAVTTLCEEYIASIKGLSDVIDARMKYLFYLIRLQIVEVALRIRDEFAQSGFEPVKCELEISADGDVKPLEFSADGVTLHTRGKIDRVDTWCGYLRIVDYKTSSKDFRLSDVLVGQNMQMLLYLYTLLKSDEYGTFLPAGILYMPAKRSTNEDDSLTMNGLLCENEELVKQMEKANAGQFVPRLKYTKSGMIDKNSSGRTYIKQDEFNLVFKKIDKVMEDVAKKLSNGDVAVSPIDCAGDDACKYCKFGAVCGIEDAPHQKNGGAKTYEVVQSLREELGGNEI